MRAFPLFALVALALCALASAFITPAAPLGGKSSSLVARSDAPQRQQVVVMACRFNAKKQKRRRNAENARKYRLKSTGPRFMGIKTQRRATKAAYAQRLELIEDDFTAKLFKYGAELDSLMVNDGAAEEEDEKPQQRGKGGKGGRKNA